MGVLRKHWFLVALLLLIPLAVMLARTDAAESMDTALDVIPTSLCTGAILFLMSVTLDTGRLLESVRRPRPVLLSCGVNQIILPLLCFPLLFLQKSADMKVGLLIAASVPCTMAAASVWTRRAEGNDAVSLLVTLLTNGLCFLITPIWMTAGTMWFGTSDASDGLGFRDMVLRLVTAALLPALAGQLVRRSSTARQFVDNHKPWFSNTAQCIILTLVFISSFRGGLTFESEGMADNLRHTEFAIVWVSCVTLHLAAIGVIWLLSRWLKLGEADRRACVFAGSQKTLPIGILVSQATGLPFSVLPILMYHASQLFIDTWIADRLKQRNLSTEPADATEMAAEPSRQ